MLKPMKHVPAACTAVLLLVLAAPPLAARQGAGSTGAAVLQLLAGGRAAALSGAYAGATEDVDVVFYNPAGLAALHAAAAVSYQRHVEDVGLITAAGALRMGRITVAAGAAFLDGGSIAVLEPDPEYGGQVGRETGGVVSAGEIAARFVIATALLDGRLHVGGGVGVAATEIAEATQSAQLFDVGAQWRTPYGTIGAALRNAGSRLSGGELAASDLPTDARLGATVPISIGAGWGATLSADIVQRLAERRAGFAVGVEAGLRPLPDEARLTAVARAGYNGVEGGSALGRLQLGGGLNLGELSVDYAFQHYEFFGALHRIGLRWHRAR